MTCFFYLSLRNLLFITLYVINMTNLCISVQEVQWFTVKYSVFSFYFSQSAEGQHSGESYFYPHEILH